MLASPGCYRFAELTGVEILGPVPRRSAQCSRRPPAHCTDILSSMDAERGIQELTRLREAANDPAIQREGPTHDEWKAKVRAVMHRALGPDSAVLRDFENVRYWIGISSGAPGELERDRQYFASQVMSAAALIDAAIYELGLGKDIDRDSNSGESLANNPSAIFLVHGHDAEAKHHVARVVQQLSGQAPVILDEQANSGLTVIEKFELYSSKAAYAIVLMTPDDVGGPKDGPVRSRARQNVVFELGFFFARIGRGRVAALTKGGVELPSDVSGIVYISLDNGDWPQRLGKEMRGVNGLSIDLNRL